jgi:hypothetical protein
MSAEESEDDVLEESTVEGGGAGVVVGSCFLSAGRTMLELALGGEYSGGGSIQALASTEGVRPVRMAIGAGGRRLRAVEGYSFRDT